MRLAVPQAVPGTSSPGTRRASGGRVSCTERLVAGATLVLLALLAAGCARGVSAPRPAAEATTAHVTAVLRSYSRNSKREHNQVDLLADGTWTWSRWDLRRKGRAPGERGDRILAGTWQRDAKGSYRLRADEGYDFAHTDESDTLHVVTITDGVGSMEFWERGTFFDRREVWPDRDHR